jgi:hypothetical protein
MRHSVVLSIVLASCAPAKPAADPAKPEPAAVTPTPEASAARPEAAANVETVAEAAKAPPPTPASSPPPSSPASSPPVVRTTSVPLAELKQPSVATIAGKPGLDLEVGERERAAVATECKNLCSHASCQCDATRPLADYLLLRVAPQVARGRDRYSWFMMQRIQDKWTVLTVTEDHPGGDTSTFPDAVCTVLVVSGPLPPDLGVARVLRLDLNLDGREDVLVECRSDGGQHYLRWCVSDTEHCDEELALRRVFAGNVELDSDVEFRDGWFVRTIRVDASGRAERTRKVEGVRTPKPPAP